MADLWGALDETKPVETPTTIVALITPDERVKRDLINHDNIRSETEQLRMSLDCSARIVVAAYKVADYVPNLQNNAHRQFWEVEVSLPLFALDNNAIQYFEIFICT
jgi:hypothetical protein